MRRQEGVLREIYQVSRHLTPKGRRHSGRQARTSQSTSNWNCSSWLATGHNVCALVMERVMIDEMSSTSTSNKQSANEMNSSRPSDHATAASALKSRGFLWKTATIKEVISKSTSISFDDEWNKFIKVVQVINGISSTTDMSHIQSTIASDEVKSDQDFHPVFVADLATVQESLDRIHANVPSAQVNLDAANAVCAWNCFKNVISPATGIVGDTATVGHKKEYLFDIALFEALRESLNGFVDELIDDQWIVLKNSTIGFGQKIKRRTLGFPRGHVLSRDSESYHGCFVLGNKTIDMLKMAKAKMKGKKAKRRKKNREY
jgi:hypothetical protein